jgi:HrpA-like RNA helicase
MHSVSLQALGIHLGSPPGDILIFMTGESNSAVTASPLAKFCTIPAGAEAGVEAGVEAGGEAGAEAGVEEDQLRCA